MSNIFTMKDFAY